MTKPNHLRWHDRLLFVFAYLVSIIALCLALFNMVSAQVAFPTHNEALSWQAGNYAHSASESQCPEQWRGLVGAWEPMLGPTGGSFRDLSLFRNDATLSGADLSASWVPSDRGWTFTFDGSDDVAESAYTADAVGVGGSALRSAVIWWRTTVNTNQAFLGYGGSGAGDQFTPEVDGSNDVSVRYTDGGGNSPHWTTTNAVDDGAWHHGVFVTPTTNTEDTLFYMDGVLQGRSNSIGGTMTTDSSTIFLGASYNGRNFAGDVAIRMYNRILSAAEAWQFYTDPTCLLRKRLNPIAMMPAAAAARRVIIIGQHPIHMPAEWLREAFTIPAPFAEVR